ncbi:MAG: PASTA domain-containing protein [Oscillospiraceae bacterium]|nr:PASTA domain-containing protein [Oscillospiraceae bacterium]
MDFLSQFDKSNYKSEPDKTVVTPPAPPQIRSEPIVVVQNTERDDIGSINAPPVDIPRDASNAAIQGPVHQMEVDRSFQMKKIIKYAIIAAAVIALCVTGIIIFRLSNRVEVKRLIDDNIGDANNWAIRNRITLEISNEFNTDYEKDIVFFQSPEAGKVQRGSIVAVGVSKGPDPDEPITIPDFSNIKSASEVRVWINEFKVANARVIQEYSDDVENGHFLRLEFRDDMVNESTYTRKDTLNIYISRGVEPISKNITVPKFVGKTKEDAETWAENNKVKLIFEEADSEDVAVNKIISQDIQSGIKIAQEDEITLIVSLGKGITVPDFNTISKNEAAMNSDLNVEVILKYSGSVPYGDVISQSVPAGTKLFGEDKKVTVTYSEGRPYIEDLVGRSENLLPAYFYELKFKGSNITYTTAYVDSSLPKGTVVSASHNSQYVDMDTVVHIQISLGNLKPEEPSLPDLPNSPDNVEPPTDDDKSAR